MLEISIKRLAEILAIGTGINGILLAILGSVNIALISDALSVIASFIAFSTGHRKRHFLERWRNDDF